MQNTSIFTLDEIKRTVQEAVSTQMGDLPVSDLIDTRARLEYDRMLRISDVSKLTGLGQSTLYYLEGEGMFPQRIPLTSNTSAWSEQEVQNWIAGRKNEREQRLKARTRGASGKRLKAAAKASAKKRCKK